jgi:hypothetical protein
VPVTSDRLVVLASLPVNRAVLDVLRPLSVPRPADDPWALDGFELHTHPDLHERLDQVASGQPGAGRSVGIYGVPALVTDDVIYAVALGTSTIDLRIPPRPIRLEVIRHGGREGSDFGPAWVSADAWVGDLSMAAGTEALRSWVAAAALAVRDA